MNCVVTICCHIFCDWCLVVAELFPLADLGGVPVTPPLSLIFGKNYTK